MDLILREPAHGYGLTNMSGFLLVVTLATVFDDPLLPERWRKAALDLSRNQRVVEKQDSSSPLQELGELLFHSSDFSGEGQRSCATCHDPTQAFQDGLTHPRGFQKIRRDTPGLWGIDQQRWFGWDGRWDSLWSQALEPIEAAEEMDSDRLQLLRWIAESPKRRNLFEKSFGPFPSLEGTPARARSEDGWTSEFLELPEDRRRQLNLAFSQAGRAIAAFEMTLQAPQSSFDQYLAALAGEDAEKASEYPMDARQGLMIFLDRGRCVFCHNGSALSDGEFHDTGLISAGSSAKDSGRYGGIMDLKKNPFNLLGDYSSEPEGAAADRTRRLKRDSRQWGAFRTPGLRGVSQTAPYFHDGSRVSLLDVVRFYSRRENARPVHQGAGHHGERLVEPLNLTPSEELLLVEFLKTL